MQSAIQAMNLRPLGAAEEPAKLDLSVVLPVFDEEDSLVALFERLDRALGAMACSYEILAINDGSRDSTMAVLRQIAETHANLRVVSFRRNYGQTAALMAGFDAARGAIVITLDADLQNDPDDIPALVAKIHEGFDVVSGYRANRKDATLTRRLPSYFANALISAVSGVKLKDYGCTLKAYRRKTMRDVRLYGEMHRLIPIYASWLGAKVVEIPVRHHARQFGQSKYGLERVYKVLLDLTVAKFLESYQAKPMYVFGGFGITAVLAAFAALGVALGLKLFTGLSLILTPLPLLAAMLFLIGCISILMGLLAEMMMRIYYEVPGRAPYLIEERLNWGPEE